MKACTCFKCLCQTASTCGQLKYSSLDSSSATICRVASQFCARAAVLHLLHTYLLQIHTPDSSRYWLADTYDERHAAGLEPQNIDKEFLRLWFRQRCDPYADKVGLLLCGLKSSHAPLGGR